MTKEAKRERRRVRHDLQRAVLANHFGVYKLYATSNQLKQAAKKVADQLLAGKNPAEVVSLQENTAEEIANLVITSNPISNRTIPKSLVASGATLC